MLQTSFINNSDIFIDNGFTSSENMANKLFCTFTAPEELDNTIFNINNRYDITYGKIFILSSEQSSELICTYNIDTGNFSDFQLPNTVLLHRKKESNTLYTINALNNLIRSLNNGFLDKSFIIDWSQYKNCILLTQGPDVRRLDTSIHKIINLTK